MLRRASRTLINWWFKLKIFIFRPFFPESEFIKYQKEFLELPGCRDISLREQFFLGNLKKVPRPIEEYYNELFRLIETKVESKSFYSIVRASDGEAFFLQNKLKGNGPLRHFTASSKLDPQYVKLFKEGLLKCDSRHVEMYKNNQKNFLEIFNGNIFSNIPFECIYALIASRRLLKTKYKIGVIGSEKKLEIIQKLLQSPAYASYIGRQDFEDYIGVPEKGTSNDVIKLAEHIGRQLKKDIDIYLVGIGIAKLAILPRLKQYSQAVFIDVGAGISALAGLVSHQRPYFADWTNFRIRNFDYSHVDIMDADFQNLKRVIML